MSDILVTRKELEALRRPHVVVEGDGWFSCPLSGECLDETLQHKCYCGAEAHNARIDALLARVSK